MRIEDNAKTKAVVEATLRDIKTRGDDAVRELSERFDVCSPPSFRLSSDEISALMSTVSDREMADILCAGSGEDLRSGAAGFDGRHRDRDAAMRDPRP